jgi:hypothetical protein
VEADIEVKDADKEALKAAEAGEKKVEADL